MCSSDLSELKVAEADKSVVFLLEPDVDANRGDLIVKKGDSIVDAVRRIRASLIWMDDRELILNRSYILALGSLQVPVMISKIESNLDIESLEISERNSVQVNDISIVEIVIDYGINLDLFENSKGFGSFILIDPLTTEYDSYVFDLAKLMQDVKCKWFIRKDNYYFDSKLTVLEDTLKTYTCYYKIGRAHV